MNGGMVCVAPLTFCVFSCNLVKKDENFMSDETFFFFKYRLDTMFVPVLSDE